MYNHVTIYSVWMCLKKSMPAHFIRTKELVNGNICGKKNTQLIFSKYIAMPFHSLGIHLSIIVCFKSNGISLMHCHNIQSAMVLRTYFSLSEVYEYTIEHCSTQMTRYLKTSISIIMVISPVLHCASLLLIILHVISAHALENGGFFFTTGPRQRVKLSFSRKRFSVLSKKQLSETWM